MSRIKDREDGVEEVEVRSTVKSYVREKTGIERSTRSLRSPESS